MWRGTSFVNKYKRSINYKLKENEKEGLSEFRAPCREEDAHVLQILES